MTFRSRSKIGKDQSLKISIEILYFLYLRLLTWITIDRPSCWPHPNDCLHFETTSCSFSTTQVFVVSRYRPQTEQQRASFSPFHPPTINKNMSSLDLRARLKRDLSFSSTNSFGSLSRSSHGSSLRAPKRWKSSDVCANQRKVSFGQLNETVLFDKKDSSNHLSLGVSVSNSSFSSMRQRSSTNFRWGEEGPASGIGNATWGDHPPHPHPQDARWECSTPSNRPTVFPPSSSTQSSATANAFTSIAHRQSTNVQHNIFLNPQQQRPAFPARCPSPTQDASMEDVQGGITKSCSLLNPPRRPGRCASPVNEDVQRGVTTTSCSLMTPPRRPGRCASPLTILPEPIYKGYTAAEEEEESVTPVFGMPPNRPVRSTSPATVTPRSSFTLRRDPDIDL